MLLLHEVASPAVLDLTNVFHAMTASIHDSADDRCTSQVFWWLGGDLRAVQVATSDDLVCRRVVLPTQLKSVVECPRPGERAGAGCCW
jgi:hypothetical protein